MRLRILKFFKLTFIFIILISEFSFAQKQPAGKAKVLDFEGEQIEGDRMRPDLFLQISTENLKFDTLMYMRENFNDFHDVDRASKPRYLKPNKK